MIKYSEEFTLKANVKDHKTVLNTQILLKMKYFKAAPQQYYQENISHNNKIIRLTGK